MSKDSKKEKINPEKLIPHFFDGFYKFEISEEKKTACERLAPEIIKINEIEGKDCNFVNGLAYGYDSRNKEIVQVLKEMIHIYHLDFEQTGNEESKGKVSLAKYLLSKIE